MFNPIVYRTKCCNDRLYSRFPGEFKKCGCGHIAVDQTEYYERTIGDNGLLEPIGRLHDSKEETEEG
jgi:hypothetical protein